MSPKGAFNLKVHQIAPTVPSCFVIWLFSNILDLWSWRLNLCLLSGVTISFATWGIMWNFLLRVGYGQGSASLHWHRWWIIFSGYCPHFDHLVLKCPSHVPYVSLGVLSSFSRDWSSICHKGRLNADDRMSPEVPHNSVVIEVSGSGSKRSNYSSCFLPCGLFEIPKLRAIISQRSQQDILHRLLWMLEEGVVVVFRAQHDKEILYIYD